MGGGFLCRLWLRLRPLLLQALKAAVQLRQNIACHFELLGGILARVMLHVLVVSGGLSEDVKQGLLQEPDLVASGEHTSSLLWFRLVVSVAASGDVLSQDLRELRHVWNPSDIFDVHIAAKAYLRHWVGHAFVRMGALEEHLAFVWVRCLRVHGW